MKNDFGVVVDPSLGDQLVFYTAVIGFLVVALFGV